MKRHPTRNILCAMALCLLPAVAISGLADAPTFDISLVDLPTVDYRPTILLGDPVVIHNAEAPATPLLSVPSVNDLEIPLGLYLNGVEAREIERGSGFVRIAIGGDGLNAGISGYVQAAHVAPTGAAAAPAPAPPTVTLRGEAGEEIQLLQDYAGDAAPVAVHPPGTEARLLGWLDTWCQVQIGEETGFVRTDQLAWPEVVEADLTSVPVEHFDHITPQAKHAMDIMNAYYEDREAAYGPDEFWPIEIRAECAALSVQLGRGQIYDDGLDILPGPEDLTQAEALAIVERVVQEYHGIPPEELAEYDVTVHFYSTTYQHPGRNWHFFFWDQDDPGRSPMRFTVSSPAGEVWPY